MNNRISQIDAVKFIASIIIVFHHYQQNFQYEKCLVQFGSNQKFYWGYIVELFFVISGFVIARSNNRNQHSDFYSFISKKICRIIPLVMVTVGIDAIARIIYRICCGDWIRNGELTVWMILSNAFLIHSGGAVPDYSSNRLNPPIWYLSVLLICYVVYYFSLWLASRLSINYNWIFLTVVFGALGGLCYEIDLPFLSEPFFRGVWHSSADLFCMKYTPV